MIDLHGDLAGILGVANGNPPAASTKHSMSRDSIHNSALLAVVDWAKKAGCGGRI